MERTLVSTQGTLREPVTVVAHPQGGWTHAVPEGDHSSIKLYCGNWPTKRAAELALPRPGRVRHAICPDCRQSVPSAEVQLFLSARFRDLFFVCPRCAVGSLAKAWRRARRASRRAGFVRGDPIERNGVRVPSTDHLTADSDRQPSPQRGAVVARDVHTVEVAGSIPAAATNSTSGVCHA